MDEGPGECVRLSVRRRDARFDIRRVAIGPGCERPYDAAEWEDALVFVEHGEIELESSAAGSRRFGPGDVLCLAGLSLRALRNPGPDQALLVAVSRRDRRRDGTDLR
jgi:quercetin dioxygenase-like cupin family protein